MYDDEREYNTFPNSMSISAAKMAGITLEGPTDLNHSMDLTTSGFIKYDNAKNRLSLIDPLFITELGEVLTHGAVKYAPDNWKLCEDPTRYKDALLRHLYAYLSGELIDPDSGLPHTSAIAFNTMALRWFDRQHQQKGNI